MSKIRLLDKTTIDLIAAGEVVDRPSSIVKELTENSLDAGAGSITIEIRRGGRELIKVTDDGCGMSPEDALMSIRKHATSKITSSDDFCRLTTFGFRGEALAAISSVSRVRLLTGTEDSVAGTEICVSGGEVESNKEKASGRGTTVEVRDLFYNVPARLKFLKNDLTEGGVVQSYVEKLAISEPGVRFTYIADGKIRIRTSGNGNLIDAIHDVLGKDFAEEMIPVSFTDRDITVSGYIGKPLFSKANRNHQIFFVNTRYIKSAILQKTLDGCYRNNMLVGRYPVCVLFVSIDPSLIDINVHPSKLDIKFSDERTLVEVLQEACRKAFFADTGVNTMKFDFSKRTVPEESKTVVTEPSKPVTVDKTGTDINTFKASENKKTPPQDVMQFVTSFLPPVQNHSDDKVNSVEHHVNKDIDQKNTSEEKQVKNNKKSGFWEIITPDDRVSAEEDKDAKSSLTDLPKIEVPDISDDNLIDFSVQESDKNKGTETVAVSSEKDNEPATVPAPADVRTVSTVTVPVSDDIIPLVKNDIPNHRLVGEVFMTYLIVEEEDDILFIDKHALHERINFEYLKNTTSYPSQLLLVPYVADIGPEETAVLMNNKDMICNIGFDIDELDGTLLVREIPSICDSDDIEYILNKFCEAVSSKKYVGKDLFDEFLYSIACKASIRSGMNTSENENSYLVSTYYEKRDSLKYCPHGRPTVFSISKKSIEKQFRRII